MIYKGFFIEKKWIFRRKQGFLKWNNACNLCRFSVLYKYKSKGYIMNRRKKIFNRVVNPLLLKYLTDPHGSEVSIAKNIPMKYLPYFKEVTGSGNGMKVRYRFRGTTGINMNAVGGYYIRPQSFCHLEGAKTFSVYER